MPKTQQLSPIYKEISDFKKVKKRIEYFLLAIEKLPWFQELWKDTVEKQFNKGVKKYGKTLDDNERKTGWGWLNESLEELVDWAAYDVKREIQLDKEHKSKTK